MTGRKVCPPPICQRSQSTCLKSHSLILPDLRLEQGLLTPNPLIFPLDKAMDRPAARQKNKGSNCSLKNSLSAIS